MKALAVVAPVLALVACGTQSKPLPDPGSAATVVTVLDNSHISVSVRQRGNTRPLRLPGPVMMGKGERLQLNLQQVPGDAAWTEPTSSNPDVLRFTSDAQTNGYLVAQFRTVKQGTAELRARFPCGPGACAALSLELDIVVNSSQPID